MNSCSLALPRPSASASLEEDLRIWKDWQLGARTALDIAVKLGPAVRRRKVPARVVEPHVHLGGPGKQSRSEHYRNKAFVPGIRPKPDTQEVGAVKVWKHLR